MEKKEPKDLIRCPAKPNTHVWRGGVVCKRCVKKCEYRGWKDEA